MSTKLVKYWVDGVGCIVRAEPGTMSSRYVYLAEDVERVLDDVRHTLELLRDYTYLDAEPPELRSQNQRCQVEAQRLLAQLGRKG